jgi:hypothetical protein
VYTLFAQRQHVIFMPLAPMFSCACVSFGTGAIVACPIPCSFVFRNTFAPPPHPPTVKSVHATFLATGLTFSIRRVAFPAKVPPFRASRPTQMLFGPSKPNSLLNAPRML